MAKKRLEAQLGADTSEFDSKIKKAGDTAQNFGSVIKKVGAALASAFAVEKIITFSKEAMHLSAQLEGIAAAFGKLDQPTLLDDLKTATRGTVSELSLMQKAVQAKNFKIPLDQLATFFEFATNRAIQTGESVDYLVNSLVTGLGRKSVLVMDNLGISAVELQEEVAKVGDFGIAAGNIIRRELASMGEVADTTATKMQKITATSEDIKAAWGNMINSSAGVQKAMGDVAATFENMSERMALRTQKKNDPLLNWFQRTFSTVDDYKKLMDEVARRQEILDKQAASLYNNFGVTGPSAPADVVEEQATTLMSLNEELANQEELLANINIADTKAITLQNQKIKGLKDQIAQLIKLGVETKELEKVSNEFGGKKIYTDRVGLDKMGLKGGPAYVPTDSEILPGLEQTINLVSTLDSTFQNMFANTQNGLRGMAESFKNAIAQMAAQLAAKAAIFGILSLISGGGGGLAGIAGKLLGGTERRQRYSRLHGNPSVRFCGRWWRICFGFYNSRRSVKRFRHSLIKYPCG
jgi:hypothetical protein